MKSRKLLTMFLAALMIASMAPAAIAADEKPESPTTSEQTEPPVSADSTDKLPDDQKDVSADIDEDEPSDNSEDTPSDENTDSSKPTEPTQVIVPVIHKKNATPSASSVLVNGTKTAFDAYTIDGFTYFKLRDIAAALTGTPSAFDVQWNAEKFCIELTTGKDYAKQDDDLMTGQAVKPVIASSTKMGVILNGEEAELSGYSIEGNTYFQLRDLGEQLGFAVDWNAVEKSIAITSETPDASNTDDTVKDNNDEIESDDTVKTDDDESESDDTVKTDNDENKSDDTVKTDDKVDEPDETTKTEDDTEDKAAAAVK